MRDKHMYCGIFVKLTPLSMQLETEAAGHASTPMAQQQHTLAAKVAWCATSLIVIYLCVGKVSVAGKPGLAYPVLVFALSQALYYWMVSGACLALCCDIPLAMAHGMHQVVCSLYRTHVKDPFGRQVQFFHQAPNYQSIMEGISMTLLFGISSFALLTVVTCVWTTHDSMPSMWALRCRDM